MPRVQMCARSASTASHARCSSPTSSGVRPTAGSRSRGRRCRPSLRASSPLDVVTQSPKSLAELAADGSIDPGWAIALEPVADRIADMGSYLRGDVAAGLHYLPAGQDVLRAFRTPLQDVRVLIVGQDPYPTPGHPIGLSFAVDRHVRPLPRSLQNIYRELQDDLGVVPPAHGDLSGWSENGVMLLNRVLTVRPGEPASHRGKGWEPVTEHAIRALVARN